VEEESRREGSTSRTRLSPDVFVLIAIIRDHSVLKGAQHAVSPAHLPYAASQKKILSFLSFPALSGFFKKGSLFPPLLLSTPSLTTLNPKP
jgi:hypothetical protein